MTGDGRLPDGPRDAAAAVRGMGVGHRVEILGRLVHDDYLPKEGNAVLALLPD